MASSVVVVLSIRGIRCGGFLETALSLSSRRYVLAFRDNEADGEMRRLWFQARCGGGAHTSTAMHCCIWCWHSTKQRQLVIWCLRRSCRTIFVFFRYATKEIRVESAVDCFAACPCMHADGHGNTARGDKALCRRPRRAYALFYVLLLQLLLV